MPKVNEIFLSFKKTSPDASTVASHLFVTLDPLVHLKPILSAKANPRISNLSLNNKSQTSIKIDGGHHAHNHQREDPFPY
jgi:hypothetical protein